jgi:hypothetical protein
MGMLAARTLRASDRTQLGRVLFIGERLRPYAPALPSSLGACVHVTPASLRDRVWAVDCALRCPGVSVVIADASGFDLTATRRGQLAAQAGGVLAMLARPMNELRGLSAASARWSLTPAVSDDRAPRWRAELLRCKGVQPECGARRWWLRIDHETGDVCVAPASGDRPGEPARSARRGAG